MRSRITAASRCDQRPIPITAAKLNCQPTSPAASGESSSVTAAASSTIQARSVARPSNPARIPATPMTAARWIEGPPPAIGT